MIPFCSFNFKINVGSHRPTDTKKKPFEKDENTNDIFPR